MATGLRIRQSKSVSSIRYCEERFSCDDDRTLAKYVCDECGTLQCSRCESTLHQLARHVFHDRRRLSVPTVLCQANSCVAKNLADVRCADCSMIFCRDCSDQIHCHSPASARAKRDKKSITTMRSHKVTALNGLRSASETMVTDDQSESGATSGDKDDEMFCDVLSPATDVCSSGLADPHTDSRETQSSVDKHATQDNPATSSKQDASISANLNLPQCTSAHNMANDLHKSCTSFLLADQQENLKVLNEDEFVAALRCQQDTLVKVVSVFGNTGDGKSFTLNQTFFGGHPVFQTLNSQLSCTVGVWAAYDPVNHAVIVDTEGLLGVSANENQRTRLLLKVLAISDVVIYRSCAERLHNDLFHFLGDASKAYRRHFSSELTAAVSRGRLKVALSDLGPAVIVFHETQHTQPLMSDGVGNSPESFLRQRFRDLDLKIDAFSSLEYVGTRTMTRPTDFTGILTAVRRQLANVSVRSSRRPAVIYNALKVLNEKFIGEIEKSVPSTFPDEYFSCTCRCISCGVRCTRSTNHDLEEIPHSADSGCQYQHQYDNKVFTCKVCYDRGREVIVEPQTAASTDSSVVALAKFAWSGYTLECAHCGVIYRSRQYWYGNEQPDKTAVRTQLRHVWAGGDDDAAANEHRARRLVDGLSYVSDGIASLSSRPVKVVGQWVTDRIAPAYWEPNHLITACAVCRVPFSAPVSVHHCRACGRGCCDACSRRQRRVPERGWADELVRVCDGCFDRPDDATRSSPDVTDELRARRVGEVISSTIGNVASLVNVPLIALCHSARPSYWECDADVAACRLCHLSFGAGRLRHHCRRCGRLVCAPCSVGRLPVPSRGWPDPVRICAECEQGQAC